MEGRDCIFMILNYICRAIWDTQVGTTDDASGKCYVVWLQLMKKEEVAHAAKCSVR